MPLSAASYDTLTGLLNEAGAAEELTIALSDAQESLGAVVVVCYSLRDSAELATHVGAEGMNSLLRLFGARLRGQVRDEDIVARLRDAVFVVGLRVPQVFTAAEATRRAAEISANIRAPIKVGRHTVAFVIRHGVAISPKDGADAEDLLSHAVAEMQGYSIFENLLGE